MKFGAIMTEVEDRNSVSFEIIRLGGVELQSNHFFSPLIFAAQALLLEIFDHGVVRRGVRKWKLQHQTNKFSST